MIRTKEMAQALAESLYATGSPEFTYTLFRNLCIPWIREDEEGKPIQKHGIEEETFINETYIYYRELWRNKCITNEINIKKKEKGNA